jgi:tRNA (cmo5U34)-methyltransferase
MTANTSAWQTGELSKTFLEGVRGAIPGAELQFAVIGKIVQGWCINPKSILDLGCGDGILGKYLLTRFPSASGHFLDFSDPMLDAARDNLKSLRTATITKADFSTSSWLDCISEYQPIDVVVSGFAIHHQPDERKQRLYSEIFDLLAPSGVFLNLEHVASSSRSGEVLFDEFFIDHLFEFHSKANPSANREIIAQYYHGRQDKKENILAPVDIQCEWLRAIGFQNVDCFFKAFELALFGGRKLSNNDMQSTS